VVRIPGLQSCNGSALPRLTLIDLIDTPEPCLNTEDTKKKAGTPERGAGLFKLIHD